MHCLYIFQKLISVHNTWLILCFLSSFNTWSITAAWWHIKCDSSTQFIREIITGLYRWGTEKNKPEHFSVAPRRWCLFTRFSPCQCEKVLFTGKQHTLVALLQMTHILKPRCFECDDMRHHHGAPSNATRHLLGKGEAYIWRFCLRCTRPLSTKAADNGTGWEDEREAL